MPNPTAQDVMAGLMAILGDKDHPAHAIVMATLRTSTGNPRLGIPKPRKRSVPDTGPVVARYFDRRGARTQPGLAPTCDTCATPKTTDERPWPTYRGMVLCPECRQEAEDHFRVALDARRQWAGCEFTQLISDDQ